MTKYDITKYLEKEDIPEVRMLKIMGAKDCVKEIYKDLVQYLDNSSTSFSEVDTSYMLNKNLENILDTIDSNEANIIKRRTGLGYMGRKFTLKEIAEIVGKTPERIRQIEAKAFRKLRHPLKYKSFCKGFKDSLLEGIGQKNPKLFAEFYNKLEETKTAKERIENEFENMATNVYEQANQLRSAIEINRVNISSNSARYKETLNKSIDELELTVRAYHALKSSHGVETVRDIVNLTERELLRTKNLARKGVNHIKEELAKYGLSLREK